MTEDVKALLRTLWMAQESTSPDVFEALLVALNQIVESRHIDLPLPKCAGSLEEIVNFRGVTPCERNACEHGA